MKKMRLQTQRLLSYKVVFSDRNDKIEDLISAVPSNSAIEFLSYHLGMKVNQLIGEHDFNIWAPWMLKTRGDVKDPIGEYAQRYNLEQYALIDKYAMLLLISKLLTCYNGGNDELTEDSLSNLLLAYMICCDERMVHNKDLPCNEMSADDFVEHFMPVCLKDNDIESPRDYRLLLIKCYMLLIEFPKHNAQFASYVDEFCKERGLHSAKSYLNEIFLTFIRMTFEDLPNCLLEVDENLRAAIHFFDSMSIDPSKYKHDDDFLRMKKWPLLKTGPRRYNFMFMKMFLDKAYTGLIFDMRDVLVKREILNMEDGYASLKALLGEEFSERFFFYTLMKRCFGGRYEHHSGRELENAIGGGVPDYYLRRGNRVFLFECKDAQMASNKKLSGDFETIKKAIYEKYVVNSKGRPKGITQLAKVITEKLPIIFKNVDNIAPNGIKYIFPVIVYFDHSFDIEGPNYLLNKEFRKIMNGEMMHDNLIIKDVVMVSIEQLMRLENFFANDKLKLATLINDYIDYKSQSDLNQVFPFNKFLFQRAKKQGYELRKTKWFDDVYNKLVATDAIVD